MIKVVIRRGKNYCKDEIDVSNDPKNEELRTALKAVLRSASADKQLAKGFRETRRAIEHHKAKICVFAANSDWPVFADILETLCMLYGVPYISVPDRKTIGRWCGIGKYYKDGRARKAVRCLCVAVKDYGSDEQSGQVLQQFFNSVE